MPVSSTAASAFSVRDVHLLVDMVRLSRVTLLLAEPGSGKSEFLRSSVVPMLNEKKRGSPGGEIGILFDDWNKAPLRALQARIRESAGAAGIALPPQDSSSLVENLEVLQDAMSETFLIVLDRFEDVLRAPQDAAGTIEFEAAFVHIANDPTLRVNFLLAIEQDAEPLLANLRRHIPRLGYSSVRLPAARATASATDRAAAVEPKPEAQATRAARRESRPSTLRSEHALLNVVPVTRTPTAPAEAAASAGRPEVSPDIAPAVTQELPAELTPAVPQPTPSAQELASVPPVTTGGATDEADHPSRVRAEALPDSPAPRRGFRLAWIPAVLVAGGIVYVLWQPQIDEMARGISGQGREAPSRRAEPSEVPPPSVPAAAPAAATVDAPPRASDAASAPAESIASRPVSPPRSDTAADSKPETAAPKPPVTAVDSAAIPETKDIRKPEAAAQKAPAAPAASARETREPRKPEAVAAKPAEAPIKPVPGESPKAQVPARDPATATAAAKPAAKAPAVASAQRPAEAVSGPVLRINVRSEAQRAWAKQMIGPLKQRGIQVTSIRLVPSHGEIAHIRYYHAAERSEAMRVAAALSELGVSARQLRQIDPGTATASARQYELWLPLPADEGR